PAIDAADNATVGFGMLFAALPATDGDGLQRFIGARSDIGAYESGDVYFVHTATPATLGAPPADYISTLSNPATDGNAAANVFFTPNYNQGGAGGVSDNLALGVYYSANWKIFREDRAPPLPTNAHFNVLVPGASSNVFRHVSSAANTSAFGT